MIVIQKKIVRLNTFVYIIYNIYFFPFLSRFREKKEKQDRDSFFYTLPENGYGKSLQHHDCLEHDQNFRGPRRSFTTDQDFSTDLSRLSPTHMSATHSDSPRL